MRPSRLCALTLASLLVLSMAGCALDEAAGMLRWAFSENEAAATAAAASPIFAPTRSPAPTVSPAPVQSVWQEHEAIAAAELYREVYDGLFTGEPIGFSVGQDGAAGIVQCLGRAGLCAFSREGAPMTAPDEIRRFMSCVEAGNAASATVYEICDDGGFLCHAFSWQDGAGTVTLTRLAWLDGGGSNLQGATPTVTYSETYALTELRLADESLYYSYYMPDNPAGTNHDGHVDTDVSIPLE